MRGNDGSVGSCGAGMTEAWVRAAGQKCLDRNEHGRNRVAEVNQVEAAAEPLREPYKKKNPAFEKNPENKLVSRLTSVNPIAIP